MLKQLCLLTYNATEAQIDNLGPIDFAILYYSRHHFLDAPWLVLMSYRSKTKPDVIEQGWLLTGKAVYFRPGTTPLKQTYDLETQAYLDAWFSRSLFKRPEFKGVRFVQTLWPRDTPPMGVVLAKMRLASNKEAREARLRRQQDWVDDQRSHGMPDTKLLRFATARFSHC